MPARAEPMKKDSIIVRSELIPTTLAATLSSATARMDLPNLVSLMNSQRRTMSTSETTMIMICIGVITAPSMW